MNRWPSRRMIGFLFIFLFAVAGCVDYQEPTGPVPAPDPGDGEFTSVVLRADGNASAPAFDSLGLAP
ncbi:MAG: hypothetical protein EXR91_02340 [Gemmatimonadetes bacterium]|nr:hypothetical protein [Gemmatimonadota bacterium]